MAWSPAVKAAAMAVMAANGAPVASAIYGIDDGFWKFHGRPSPGTLRPRDAWVSPALARELGLTIGAGAGAAAGAGAGAGAAAGGAPPMMLALAASSCDCSSRRRFLSERCTDAATKRARPSASQCAVSSRASRWASSRSGRVRATCARSSCRSARLQADLNQPEKVNAVLVSAGPGPEGGARARADADASAARVRRFGGGCQGGAVSGSGAGERAFTSRTPA